MSEGGTPIEVSILTRPCGRVLRTHGQFIPFDDALFQSSPGLAAGCFRALPDIMEEIVKFQSSPGLAAGCFIPDNPGSSCHYLFQSSPGLAAGCFATIVRLTGAVVGFNPHPALRPGASKGDEDNQSLLQFQSSPGLAAGCFRPASFRGVPFFWFQSSPGLAAGCFEMLI